MWPLRRRQPLPTLPDAGCRLRGSTRPLCQQGAPCRLAGLCRLTGEPDAASLPDAAHLQQALQALNPALPVAWAAMCAAKILRLEETWQADDADDVLRYALGVWTSPGRRGR
jgi:hypothetical protein